jgi:hypothetical protein
LDIELAVSVHVVPLDDVITLVWLLQIAQNFFNRLDQHTEMSGRVEETIVHEEPFDEVAIKLVPTAQNKLISGAQHIDFQSEPVVVVRVHNIPSGDVAKLFVAADSRIAQNMSNFGDQQILFHLPTSALVNALSSTTQ